MEEYGVKCGKYATPSTDEILAKLGPTVNYILKKHLVFPAHHNTQYTQHDFRKVAVYAAINRDFAENSSKAIKHDNEESYRRFGFQLPAKRYQKGEIFLWHVKKFDLVQLYAMSDGITAEIIRRARRVGAVSRKMDLAIDWTDIPYYGDKNDPMVRGKKPERGTDYSHSYLSSNIVIAGQRFTIKVIALERHTPLHVAVEKLIVHAKTLINIDHVLLDKGFNSGRIISVLKKSGCNFVMPAINNPKIRRFIRMNPLGKTIRYEIGSDGVYTYLAIAKNRKEEKAGYFVNSEHTCLARYSKRWGIETSYKKIKRDFLPQTTSKNPIVRLFYFLLADCLYNLWLLSNLLIQPQLSRQFSRYMQTAKEFEKDLWSILTTGEFRPPPSITMESLGSLPATS